jgi:vacuolar iron transporter family protein
MSKHQTKLNWLRASVLGANDGIVSIAGLVVGVASATTSQGVILTAGIAGIIAGAISMAAGEYVSVSSSRDTEISLINKERYLLKYSPKEELKELAEIYKQKGLMEKTAIVVASELTVNDAASAHFEAEYGIDPNNLNSPWHAALASSVAFLIGAIIPLITIIACSVSMRIPVTFVSVIFALALTGIFSAKAGGANIKKAIIRVVSGGVLAMSVTYGIGRLFQVSGI